MAMTSATATCGICGDFECFSCLTCNRILAEHDCDCDPVQLACGHRVFRCCSADKLIPTAKKVASTPPARCPDCNQDFNGKNSSLAEVHACQPLREAMQSITCGCRYCRSCAYKPAKKVELIPPRCSDCNKGFNDEDGADVNQSAYHSKSVSCSFSWHTYFSYPHYYNYHQAQYSNKSSWQII